MSWRSNIDVIDKVGAVCVYSLPLFEVRPFGVFLLGSLPENISYLFIQVFNVIIAPVDLITRVFASVGLGAFSTFIIFFALYLGVAQNQRLSHFLRFNGMQALLIDIFLILCGIIAQIFLRGAGESLIVQTLFNVIFLGTLAACFYSMIQSALGKYAELPTISDAANSQVR